MLHDLKADLPSSLKLENDYVEAELNGTHYIEGGGFFILS